MTIISKTAGCTEIIRYSYRFGPDRYIQLPRRRILIVDDEEDITSFLKKALEQHDFDVVTINDPLETVSSYKAGSYDLILLDIKMPKMNGFELYQKLQEIDNKAKICFMTAFEVYYDALKELFPNSYSDLCFLKKPFSVQEFIKKISKEMAQLRADVK